LLGRKLRQRQFDFFPDQFVAEHDLRIVPVVGQEVRQRVEEIVVLVFLPGFG
jgi:hypothetical protein